MAPIPLPPENKESYTLTGTGTILLTLAQRTSRRLSISVEKIFIGPLLSYYNFRIPEPSTFWGYLQTVNRDSIIDTFELKFRRESIVRWDTYELEPIEQLRCLIKESTILLFDTATNFYISQGADGAALGQDRANYLLNVGQPRLIPSNPITGIYYEIEGNHLCQITLIWQGYAAPCENPSGNQTLPAPRSPGGGESGTDSGGGGGTRPANPPPPDRSADPDSDSPAPPPDSPAGPPSPTPAPVTPPTGDYRLVILYKSGVFADGICTLTDQAVAYNLIGNGPGNAITRQQNGEIFIEAVDVNGVVLSGLTSFNSASPCPGSITSVTNTPL
jgi:hypothetical protein